MPKDKAREKTETWTLSAAAADQKSEKDRWDRRDAERGHRAGAEAAAAAPEESHAPRTMALQEAAASGEPGRGLDTNTEEEKNTQPERRMEELEAEFREQETELKGLRKQTPVRAAVLPRSSRRPRENENPEDRGRSLKTDTEERKRPQGHLEVEANSFPELLDRKFNDPLDFRSGLPMLGTNS
ncbi:hypothetical protein P7K49_018831 [Saguinus oedipus]|uniref:Uncharacterized protein n=1 Tax=Saguinus oedipus TaxID=9490 RepID=A0ABQ9V6L2_SAGOE|nr:hypothetical protein P7K49_018831 [Saguinus oedipus]